MLVESYLKSQIIMKRILFLYLFLFVSLIGYTQDFQPGPQAQNLIEHKNVMVDYSTGVLHYTVPIYSLKSGNYELPISLDYIGRGVKYYDRRGMLGLNWTLNIGGVVTRTVRGGIADEEHNYGYLWTADNSIPLKDDCKNVSLRKRDGESDIFTAVFNGKSINFIIRADEQQHIYAEPLELTNVRIICEGSSNFIEGWSIIDENGDHYIYRQQEWSLNARREDVSTLSGIACSEYISAWHLTKIIPCNSAPIEFLYKKNIEINSLDGQDQWSTINKAAIGKPSKMKYEYGSPVIEYPFDFDKYIDEYRMYIDEARSYLIGHSFDLQVKEAGEKATFFYNYGMYASNTLDYKLSNELSRNFRIIGLLGDIEGAMAASEDLLRTLQNLENSINHFATTHEQLMAATFIASAKQVVVKCMHEKRNINKKEIKGGSGYDVYSPILAMIVTPERIIEFGYKNGGKNDNILTSITVCDWFKDPISIVSLDCLSRSLDEISFLDKNGTKISNILFDYYVPSPSLKQEDLIPDFWGDFQVSSTVEGKYGEIAALYSLKNISLPDGGNIEIAYERNQVGSGSIGTVHGGIRLKFLAFTDGMSSAKDTISYDYPLPGRSVYDSFSNSETVRYAGFSDKIVYDQIRTKGYAFLNLGNNGIYYPYVQENIHKKGINTYLYQVPGKTSEGIYGFWLNGLLLGKAMYDEQGNLKQMTKYIYGMEIDEYPGVYSEVIRDHFVNDARLSYNCSLPQMQASDYYMDGESLKYFYEKQSNDYIDGAELYRINIQPRLNPTLPPMDYRLCYGGKVLLRKELDYKFEGDKTAKASYNDFFIPLKESPFHKIEYYYDNVRSAFPTRIAKTGADGNVYTTVYKRVVDMSLGIDSVIDEMKRKNILSPIVKKLNLSNDQLLTETIWRYCIDKQSDSCLFAPIEQLVYIPESTVVYSVNNEDISLFTYGESNYEKVTLYKYVHNKVSYLPIEEDACTKGKSYAYDDYGHLLLDCQGVGASATDKYKMPRNKLDNASYAKLVYEEFYKFFSINQQLDILAADSDIFFKYCHSDRYKSIILFITETLKASMNPNLGLLVDLQFNIKYNQLLDEFEQQYNAFLEAHPQYTNWKIPNALSVLRSVVTSPEYADVPFAKYMYQLEYKTNSPYNTKYSIRLTTIPGSKRLKLYVLDGSRSISCQVSHAGGRTNYIPSECNSSSMLKVFDLDLSAYEDITAVDIPSSGVYMTLVPEGSSFKATSYNFDGTIYARFDETMNLELYSYDSAGRVIQTKDQYGNILKEYKYNQVINE